MMPIKIGKGLLAGVISTTLAVGSGAREERDGATCSATCAPAASEGSLTYVLILMLVSALSSTLWLWCRLHGKQAQVQVLLRALPVPGVPARAPVPFKREAVSQTAWTGLGRSHEVDHVTVIPVAHYGASGSSWFGTMLLPEVTLQRRSELMILRAARLKDIVNTLGIRTGRDDTKLVLSTIVACSSNLTPLQVRSVTDRFVDGVSDPRLYLSRYFDVSSVAR